jgi:KUP system potassium uptake protein
LRSSALASAAERGLKLSAGDYTTWRHLTLLSDVSIGMSGWRDRLFNVMSHNVPRATNFFCIPPDSVVDLGIHLEV